MAILKLDGGAGFFNINEDVFPIGKYRIEFKLDNIGLVETNGNRVVFPTPFGDWRDSADGTYANRAALLTDLESKIY